jgi:hypothetical protein
MSTPEEPSTLDETLYEVALKVTDEVMGAGAYASLHAGDADPGVQAAIRTHAADAAAPDPEWRMRVKRGADLCQAEPATYAEVVRLSDRLQAQGLERVRAFDQALEEYGA